MRKVFTKSKTSNIRGISMSNRITIEIIDSAMWIQYEENGSSVYTAPLALSIRTFLEPEYKEDTNRGDGFNTEQAFKKMEINKAFRHELDRA